MYPTQWDTADFDNMSWEDVHVHGLQIVPNGLNQGTADLVFDIDYILEWIKPPYPGKILYAVAQASLRFHEVMNLRVDLDYSQLGVGTLELLCIVREPLTNSNGSDTFRWRFDGFMFMGTIEFEAPRFTQTLIGPIHTQPEDHLDPSQRIYGPIPGLNPLPQAAAIE